MATPFLVRPLSADDAPAVAAFFASAHRGDPGVEFVPVASWMAFTAYPSNRGAKDFAVAEAEGRIVGLLTSTVVPGKRRGRRRRHFRIVVHPEFRGRGIGSALFGLLEGQPIPGPRPVLQSISPRRWTLALRFLRQRGFRPVHRDFGMERSGGAVPRPSPPDGIALRPFGRPGDFDAWIRLHAEGYRGDFHFEPLTRAAIRAERAGPGALVLVAEEGRRVAGVALARDRGRDGGAVQSLLVARRLRGRGVGRALLRAVVAGLAARGRRSVSLGVSSGNRPAIRLYASEGFRTVREDLTLWRGARR